MAYLESDLLPLSALQHFIFCKRQCALIHIERVWIENKLTAEGRLLHASIDKGDARKRGEVHVSRSLPLKSRRLGLSGVADVVEFHQSTKGRGINLPYLQGYWKPYPVEYKRGVPKKDNSDRVQICAQAMCLEEQYNINIPQASLFYGKIRRRQIIDLDESLRSTTMRTAEEVHKLIAEGRVPKVEYEAKCDSCSLYEYCQPKTIGSCDSAEKFWKRFFMDFD